MFVETLAGKAYFTFMHEEKVVYWIALLYYAFIFTVLILADRKQHSRYRRALASHEVVQTMSNVTVGISGEFYLEVFRES